MSRVHVHHLADVMSFKIKMTNLTSCVINFFLNILITRDGSLSFYRFNAQNYVIQPSVFMYTKLFYFLWQKKI